MMTATPTTAPKATNHKVYLPLVQNGTTTILVAPLLSKPLEERRVTRGEVFAIDTFTMPTRLPRDGTFYLSSSPTQLLPARVDDRIVLKVNGGEVFRYTYGLPPERLTAPSVSYPNVVNEALIPVPRQIVARLAGNQVIIEFVDVYGGHGSASSMYLVWSDQ